MAEETSIPSIALNYLYTCKRYQRGSRSLTDNLNAGDGTTQGKVDESKNLAQEDEEEYDIPDEMEEVIGRVNLITLCFLIVLHCLH